MYRELEVFRAVMLTGSTSQASKMLDVSQPAISQQLKKLEQRYEIELFERNRGRLIPTREALALMEEVEAFFSGLVIIDHKLRSLKQGFKRGLKIAVHPAFGNFVVPTCIARFRQDHDIPISLEVASSANVYQRVHSGEIDFGIIANEIETKDCEQYRICNVRGLIVSPPGLIDPSVKILTENDIQNHQFLALNPEDHSRLQLEAYLKGVSKELNVVVQTPYAMTICELASLGVGVGLTHPITLLNYLPGKVEARLFVHDIHFTSKLIFRKDARLSGEAKEFIRILRIQMEHELQSIEQKIGLSVRL